MSESKELKTYSVYLKNGTIVTVKAARFESGQSSLLFRDALIFLDAGGKPMEEHFVAISEVAAVIPKEKSHVTAAASL